MIKQVEQTEIKRTQQWHATVTRACKHCGAKGDDQSHFEEWNCHVCGWTRPPDDAPYGGVANPHGNVVSETVEIWHLYQSLWRRFLNKINKLI